MKIDIIFVHFAVVAAVAIPYILFILAAASQRKHLKLRFNKEAKDLDLKLDLVDRWNSNIIGIDKSRQKVLFVQRRREEIFAQVIDLKTVKGSLLLHQTGTVKIDEKKEEVLQKVELELSMYNGDKQVISFFDCDMTYYEDYEMKNAGKWSEIIKSSLTLRPLLHSAA